MGCGPSYDGHGSTGKDRELEKIGKGKVKWQGRAGKQASGTNTIYIVRLWQSLAPPAFVSNIKEIGKGQRCWWVDASKTLTMLTIPQSLGTQGNSRDGLGGAPRSIAGAGSEKTSLGTGRNHHTTLTPLTCSDLLLQHQCAGEMDSAFAG